MAFLDVINITNVFHMDADVSATAQRGSCLLTERVSFNTQQALLSYPDRAIMTHRNSVTGKEALTNRN